MGTRTANTAAGTVMRQPEEKQPDDYETSLNRFRISLSVFRDMVKNAVLTDEDYGKVCAVLAEKYGISLCSIFL